MIGHDDGTGDQWAVEQVNGKTTAYHDALEMVREGQVIPRTLERAKYSKVEGSEGLARFILRDAKNHIEAFNLAKSDSDVEPSEYWWTRPKLCGERKALVTPRNEPISFERYSQLAEIVNEISRPRSLKDLIDIKAKHGESFRHALWGLFGDEVTPAANEQVRLEEFARKQSWLEMAIGKGVADRVANTIGLVGLITSTLDVLTNQGSSLGVVELTAGFFPLAKNAAINRGFIPMRQWQEGDPISAALLQEPAVPWLPYWKGPRADKLREVALTLKGLNRM
ncbi:MAG: hypothetical protein FD124_195 [Alphaproteobacteria bacterium]|nr:MAG: hypothetical protein FD124_195 [Alphaproteobacteria bacterium]